MRKKGPNDHLVHRLIHRGLWSCSHCLDSPAPCPANRGNPKGCRGAPTLEDRGVLAIAYGEAERADHKNVASETPTDRFPSRPEIKEMVF